MRRSDLLKSPSMDDEFFTHMRFVEPEDADFICGLRSDPALNQHISKTSNSVQAQKDWIQSYKERERKGTEFYFVIQHQLQAYGVVRMYDFRDDSFCWGSWIISPNRPSGLVTYSAVMIYEMGFDFLGFEQSHFDVRLGNQKVIDFHLRSGARPTKRDDVDQHFVFLREDWVSFKNASITQIKQHRIFHG